MASTLADILTAQGLDRADLQRAAARQFQSGGTLDTALLELGLIAEQPLAAALAQAAQLPRPSLAALTDGDRALASLFPKELAARYGMVPIGLTRRQLSLLAKHPVELATIDEISFLLSRPLKLYVGLELEVAALTAKVYGLAPSARLIALQQQLRQGLANGQPTPPAGGPQPTPILPATAPKGPRVEAAPIVAIDLDDLPTPPSVLAQAKRREVQASEPQKEAATPGATADKATPDKAPPDTVLTDKAPPAELPATTGPTTEAQATEAGTSVTTTPFLAMAVQQKPPRPSPASAQAAAPFAPPLAPATPLPPPPSPPSAREWAPTLPPADEARAGLSAPLAAAVAAPLSQPWVGPGRGSLNVPLDLPVSAPIAATAPPPPEPSPGGESASATLAEAGPAADGGGPPPAGKVVDGAAPPAGPATPPAGAAVALGGAPTAAESPAATPPAVLAFAGAPKSVGAPSGDPPSPFDPGGAPAEAQPIAAGYAGRVPAERRPTAGEALIAMRAQASRDGVMGVAVDFLRGAFDFVAIFVRRGESFQVFEASGVDYGGTADLLQTVVDLDRSRVLKMVAEGRAPYVGPVPAGDPLEGALGAVGRARLRAVLLYPVVIRDRAVAVVHGDRGGEALAPRQLSDTALVLSQLGLQLERVLRERRRPAALGKTLRGVGGAPLDAGGVAASGEAPATGPAPVDEKSAARAEPPSPRPTWELPQAAVSRLAAASVDFPEPTGNRAEAGGFDQPLAEASLSQAFGEDRLALQGTGAAAERDPAVDGDGEEPFEVPIEWIDLDDETGLAAQVRTFLSGDPPARARAAAVLREGGEAAGWALAERFPGPLFVFRSSFDELPAPEALGPLLGLLGSLGEMAIPALTEIAESPGVERRFWATVLLAKLGSPQGIPALARRLIDPAPDVALAARRGLWRLRRAPGFQPMLAQLSEELTTTDLERLASVLRALGQFRQVASVPKLISLVAHRDPSVAAAAIDALRDITRQDLGNHERRWSAWWNENQQKPRLQWLIEALDTRDRDLRLSAISELTELTGFDFGYRSDLEPQKQIRALTQWREWWEREGKGRPSI